MNIFDRFRELLTKTAAPTPAKPATSAKFVRPLPVPDDPLLAPVDRRKRKRKDARKGSKAVIIDDSATVVAVLRRILRSAGYNTRDAADAETGLQLIAEDKPDLIFLDIVLPGMNGFGALRVLRRDAATQYIPVIMISGNEHATEQFYANRIGADSFMKKPFSRSEVFAHIENLLDEDLVPRRAGYVAEATKPAADEPTM